MDNPFAGVGAIVIREGEILLVRHTYGAAAGKLLNPGGMLQAGEMPEQAVVREVMEETGVTIEPIGMLALRCSAKGWYMVFLARYVSGEPQSDNDENSQALFMPCQELLARDDATDTVKALTQLALTQSPLPPQDAGAGRVMYAPKG